MSTRSQTILLYDHEPAVKFYRHCDGYPKGHGADLVTALDSSNNNMTYLLAQLQTLSCGGIEIEPIDTPRHGDLEYYYIVNLSRFGKEKDPYIIIEHRNIGAREWHWVFSGTPEELETALREGNL